MNAVKAFPIVVIILCLSGLNAQPPKRVPEWQAWTLPEKDRPKLKKLLEMPVGKLLLIEEERKRVKKLMEKSSPELKQELLKLDKTINGKVPDYHEQSDFHSKSLLQILEIYNSKEELMTQDKYSPDRNPGYSVGISAQELYQRVKENFDEWKGLRVTGYGIPNGIKDDHITIFAGSYLPEKSIYYIPKQFEKRRKHTYWLGGLEKDFSPYQGFCGIHFTGKVSRMVGDALELVECESSVSSTVELRRKLK